MENITELIKIQKVINNNIIIGSIQVKNITNIFSAAVVVVVVVIVHSDNCLSRVAVLSIFCWIKYFLHRTKIYFRGINH